MWSPIWGCCFHYYAVAPFYSFQFLSTYIWFLLIMYFHTSTNITIEYCMKQGYQVSVKWLGCGVWRPPASYFMCLMSGVFIWWLNCFLIFPLITLWGNLSQFCYTLEHFYTKLKFCRIFLTKWFYILRKEGIYCRSLLGPTAQIIIFRLWALVLVFPSQIMNYHTISTANLMLIYQNV